jgi:hypothetical protein
MAGQLRFELSVGRSPNIALSGRAAARLRGAAAREESDDQHDRIATDVLVQRV